MHEVEAWLKKWTEVFVGPELLKGQCYEIIQAYIYEEGLRVVCVERMKPLPPVLEMWQRDMRLDYLVLEPKKNQSRKELYAELTARRGAVAACVPSPEELAKIFNIPASEVKVIEPKPVLLTAEQIEALETAAITAGINTKRIRRAAAKKK